MSEHIDNEIVGQMVELMEDAFQDLVDVFTQDTPTQINNMRDAMVSDDRVSLRRAAHTLKSSAGNLGALLLSQMAAELEAAAETIDFSVAETAVVEMEAEFAIVKTELEAL